MPKKLATKGHTATYRGRKVTVQKTDGSFVHGRFLERTANKGVILDTPAGKVRIPRDQVFRFLTGHQNQGREK